jgi:hypothetical protein
MTRLRAPLVWLVLLVAAGATAAWIFPRAMPLLLPDWSVTRQEAEEIALARLGALGELPAEPYVVSRLDSFALLDLRMMSETDSETRERLARSELADWVTTWEVTVYGPGRSTGEWSYRARISPQGDVLDLVLRLPREEPGETLSAADARSRADRFLAEQGFSLDELQEPETRTQDLIARTDTTVRYRLVEQLLEDRLPYGFEVHFAGDRLAGFESWYEDPERSRIEALLQPFTLVGNLRFFTLFLVLPLVGVFFVRKYHEGIVGVDRALRIFLLFLIAALIFVPLVARPATQGWNFGALTRQQMTAIWSVQLLLIFFLPQALVSALSWSVGESLCRQRWGKKLAAFDALLQREWRNRTVALSSLRGLSLGSVLAAILLLPALILPHEIGRPVASLHLGPWWESSSVPGLSLVLFLVLFTLYYELFGRLFLVPILTQKLGRWAGGLLAAAIGGTIFWGPLAMQPMAASIPVGLVFSGFLVAVFLRWDFLTSTIASATAQALISGLPFLLSNSPRLELQGWIVLGVVALPCLISLRYLGSDREFVYRYEDVPPHVRKIAERERQRVELETARNIQSSILPQLPDQLNGIEISHTYLPATEVGGDFYDVLALEDGRLALAVGDVAGHGVSSGLVMSMAKSALAVQVTFDPEVEAVFATLNRMVYQSARKRLLATLCYALLDPERHELQFASAGHLFPYRVTRAGKVESLESIAYPLGVRPTLDVVSHVAKLEAGDQIFLCSDGLVEARREGTEEHFGFDRVEEILAGQAGHGASVVRDAMLGELEKFVGDSPREDDLTILVLRLPA